MDYAAGGEKRMGMATPRHHHANTYLCRGWQGDGKEMGRRWEGDDRGNGLIMRNEENGDFFYFSVSEIILIFAKIN
ncbi:MAG: hypothetical protein II531_00010 [Bacteroidales bacterium]|nr:hypothetical protein [Bacteroidales bacterium]